MRGRMRQRVGSIKVQVKIDTHEKAVSQHVKKSTGK